MRTPLRGVLIVGTVVAVAGVGSSCNLDPVHRSAVNGLGAENADAYPPDSEFHRPGEPCALCHSKEGPADRRFILGGTIFWGPDNYEQRVDNAYVRVLDARQVTRCFVTNCNGNFYAAEAEFQNLTFPLLISVERTKEPGVDESTLQIRRMSGHIGRESSCATCHIQGIRDFGSPGQIRMFNTEAEVRAANVRTVECPPPENYRVITTCPEDRD